MWGHVPDHINPYDGRLVCASDAHGNIVFSRLPFENGPPRKKKKENGEKTDHAGREAGRALQTLQRVKARSPDQMQH